MKLADIINAVGDRHDWIAFGYGWTIDETGAIQPTMPVSLTLDTEVSVIYQWYHHLNPDFDKDATFSAIENHDFATFEKLFNKFGWDPIVYFPTKATIFAGDESVGEVVVAFSPDTFNLITDQDYECG